VEKRQKYPRAITSHRITHRTIATGKVLLHVIVTISNKGDVLLSLVEAEVRIQQVLPTPPEVLEKISSGVNPRQIDRQEISWPLIDKRVTIWKEGEGIEIEPGEEDNLYYDFVINSSIQTVEVYSHFKNAKKRPRDIGWNLTTIHDLQ
jgi:hypothetical protein